MKKNKLIIMDYLTIIIAFITFLGSLIIHKVFINYQGAFLFIFIMIANIIMIFIGFKNLKDDYIDKTV